MINMKKNMQHKVGIKVLTDVQLENVLPTYENLLEKIDECRKAAKMESKSLEKRHYQYNFMYDNVFSILGQRGSGKTSVAFTLRDKLGGKNSKHPEDVVLPLIIPEVIPDACTVLGWILAIVKEEIEQLEEKIRKVQPIRENSLNWERCTMKSYGKNETSLSERLDRMNQLLYAGSYNPHNESSYYKAVDFSVMQANDYYKFAKEIATLWDEWIEQIRYYNLLENGKRDVCPLIYFIFDDVDLAPEKIEEILSVIIKYLSHPNIIVITTADENLFLEVIQNKLDKNIGRLPVEWRKFLNSQSQQPKWPFYGWDKDKEEEKDDITSKTARMYLGKVLPTSTRYYLNSFSTPKQKQLFWVEEQKSLGQGIKDTIQDLIESIDRDNQIENFMVSKSGIINFYLHFMGDSSRQIGNIYIAINELIRNLKKDLKKENSIVYVYNHIRYFLRLAVNANHKLSLIIEAIDDFVDEIFLLNYNQWALYINYSYLDDFIKEKLSKSKKKLDIEIGLALYSLLAFCENLLLIIESGKTLGQLTERKKIHAIYPMTEFIRENVFDNKYVLRDDLDAKEYFNHYIDLLNRLPNMMLEKRFDEKFNMEYFYNFKNYYYSSLDKNDLTVMSQKNYKWFYEIVGRVFLIYGNAYLFDGKNMQKCILYSYSLHHPRYQRVINKYIFRNIVECFKEKELQKKEVLNKQLLLKEKSIVSLDEMATELKNSVGILNGIKRLQGKDEEKLARISDICSSYFDIVESKKVILKDVYTEEIARYNIGIDVISSEYLEEDIRECNENIRESENMEDVKYILYDYGNVLNVLKRIPVTIMEYYHEINDLYKELANLSIQESQIEYVEIDKKLYINIRLYLNNVIKILTRSGDEEELNILKNNIIEIIETMDICINIDNEVALKNVLRLCNRIQILSGLHKLYIFSVIKEKYDQGNNMSSKKLEKMIIDGKEKNTYYFEFFKIACDILADMESKPDDTLAKLIDGAYKVERQNYVNYLIEEVKNE